MSSKQRCCCSPVWSPAEGVAVVMIYQMIGDIDADLQEWRCGQTWTLSCGL